MGLSAGSRRRSGAAPRPGPVTLAPYGTRISTSSMRTSSMSPGRAPSTYTGPVITCAPAPSSRLTRSYIAIASGRTFSAEMPARPKYVTGSSLPLIP